MRGTTDKHNDRFNENERHRIVVRLKKAPLTTDVSTLQSFMECKPF